MMRKVSNIRVLLTALIITIAGAVLCPADALAQRRVTPVTPAKPLTPEPEKKAKPTRLPGEIPQELRERLAERTDASGRILLVDTVSGKEYVDTMEYSLPGNLYPLMHAVSVGVDIWDPVARLLGQTYGGGSVQAELSLHNRYKPTLTVGYGQGRIHPDGSNYTFHTDGAMFFMLGMKYNMFFNNNSDYQLHVGAHYGITHFSYHTTDAVIPGGYWNTPEVISIPKVWSTVGFFRFTLGIKVKLVGNLSAGWDFMFNLRGHSSAAPYGRPLYVPGLGKTGSSVGGAFTIYYTIPLNTPTTQMFEHWKEQKSRQDKRKREAENRKREANERGY